MKQSNYRPLGYCALLCVRQYQHSKEPIALTSL